MDGTGVNNVFATLAASRLQISIADYNDSLAILYVLSYYLSLFFLHPDQKLQNALRLSLLSL